VLDTIPGPLRDRIEIIHLPAYMEEEKLAVLLYRVHQQIDVKAS